MTTLIVTPPNTQNGPPSQSGWQSNEFNLLPHIQKGSKKQNKEQIAVLLHPLLSILTEKEKVKAEKKKNLWEGGKPGVRVFTCIVTFDMDTLIYPPSHSIPFPSPDIYKGSKKNIFNSMSKSLFWTSERQMTTQTLQIRMQ